MGLLDENKLAEALRNFSGLLSSVPSNANMLARGLLEYADNNRQQARNAFNAQGLTLAGKPVTAADIDTAMQGASFAPLGMMSVKGGKGLLDFDAMSTLEKERLADRMARVEGVEESYRLPNLHQAVPKDYLPPQYGLKTVTIYRGVPHSVSDATIRPGDWVSLDKNYALQHGTGETGKSKVISIQVPADHVGWAGTDMNEYFYVPR